MSALLLAFSLTNSIIFCSPWQYHKSLGMVLPRGTVVGREQRNCKVKLLSRKGPPLHFSRGGMRKTEEKTFNLPHAIEQNISSCLWGHVCWTLPIWKCHRAFQLRMMCWRVWTATGIHRTLCLLPREILVVLGIGCNLEVSISSMTAPQASTWSKKSALHWNKYKPYWSLHIPCVNPSQRNEYEYSALILPGAREEWAGGKIPQGWIGNTLSSLGYAPWDCFCGK